MKLNNARRFVVVAWGVLTVVLLVFPPADYTMYVPFKGKNWPLPHGVTLRFVLDEEIEIQWAMLAMLLVATTVVAAVAFVLTGNDENRNYKQV